MDFVKESLGLSARRSCRLIGLSRNTLRYKRKPDKDGPIRKRLKELAEQRRRSGCQLFHEIMKREGLVVNKTDIQGRRAFFEDQKAQEAGFVCKSGHTQCSEQKPVMGN